MNGPGVTCMGRAGQGHMRRHRALSFLIAALTGAVSGLPVDVHADDTEIYVGDGAAAEAVEPVITLILDTSGSMAATDGEPLDRLDRVKEALNRILDEVDNVKIGLMRFHTPGGPVLFPASSLDADSADVETGLSNEVNVRVTGSENDAEQNVATGAVILDSTQLELVDTPAFGSEVSFVASVTQSSDDAEQETGGAGFNSTRTVMDCCVRVNGLRFQSIPIPVGATVVKAHVEFVASKDDTSATSMTFQGNLHPTGSAPTFSAANDVVGRTPTAASVTWSDVPEWTVGDRFRTPNLKSIVQEIVDGAGWTAGNDLAILYTGAGARQARTYDTSGAPIDAAQLFLEWIPPGAPTSVTQLVGLRFQDVRIPQGQAIQSAFIEFVPTEDAPAAGTNLRIRAHASDDSPAFTAAANDIGARVPTVESEPWSPPAWKAGVAQQTPDITDVLEEVVGRPGWRGGNSLTSSHRSCASISTRPSRSGPARAAPFTRSRAVCRSPPTTRIRRPPIPSPSTSWATRSSSTPTTRAVCASKPWTSRPASRSWTRGSCSRPTARAAGP